MAGCIGLILLAMYLPGLAGILKVVDPGWPGWTLAGVMSLAPLLIGQALKAAGITN